MGFTNSSGEARYLCFARIQAVTAPCFTRWGRTRAPETEEGGDSLGTLPLATFVRSAFRPAGNRKAVGSASGKAGGPEVVGNTREILGPQEILPPLDELHRALDREIGRDT